jgi:hypothetical protein
MARTGGIETARRAVSRLATFGISRRGRVGVAAGGDGAAVLLPDALGDADLLERIRRGDRTALRALYERHGALVHGLAEIAARRSGLDAGDLTVDVFVELWRMPPGEGASVRDQLVRLVGRLGRGTAVAAAV